MSSLPGQKLYFFFWVAQYGLKWHTFNSNDAGQKPSVRQTLGAEMGGG